MLTFFEPDAEKFDCLKLAYEVAEMGGLYPAVMNAANEEAVKLFLDKKIKFTEIPLLIRGSLDKFTPNGTVDIEAIIAADEWTRRFINSGTLITN
jgi:1-deoxy-D-xylulose-5-phosphate reductoisomerase